jgi:predicted ester cyclase
MDRVGDRDSQIIEDLWAAVEAARFGFLERVYDADVRYYSSNGIHLEGLFQVVRMLRNFREEFQGLQARLETSVMEGGLLVSRVRMVWERPGSTLAGSPQDTAIGSCSFMSTVRLYNGRIVEEWAAFGPMDIMRPAGDLAAA